MLFYLAQFLPKNRRSLRCNIFAPQHLQHRSGERVISAYRFKYFIKSGMSFFVGIPILGQINSRLQGFYRFGARGFFMDSSSLDNKNKLKTEMLEGFLYNA
jgi:hypothetical protein